MKFRIFIAIFFSTLFWAYTSSAANDNESKIESWLSQNSPGCIEISSGIRLPSFIYLLNPSLVTHEDLAKLIRILDSGDSDEHAYQWLNWIIKNRVGFKDIVCSHSLELGAFRVLKWLLNKGYTFHTVPYIVPQWVLEIPDYDSNEMLRKHRRSIVIYIYKHLSSFLATPNLPLDSIQEKKALTLAKKFEEYILVWSASLNDYKNNETLNLKIDSCLELNNNCLLHE